MVIHNVATDDEFIAPAKADHPTEATPIDAVAVLSCLAVSVASFVETFVVTFVLCKAQDPELKVKPELHSSQSELSVLLHVFQLDAFQSRIVILISFLIG